MQPRPHRYFGDFLKRHFQLFLAVCVVGALFAFNELGFRQSNAAALEIMAAQRQRAQVKMTIRQVLDAETGQRGCLLTGQEKYLDPYNRATEAVAGTLNTAATLYLDEWIRKVVVST